MTNINNRGVLPQASQPPESSPLEITAANVNPSTTETLTDAQIEMTNMAAIQAIVAQSGRTMDDVKSVETGVEGPIESWQRTNKEGADHPYYAQIPLKFTIRFKDNLIPENPKTVTFKKPSFTNIKIPLTGTPKERENFDSKVSGVVRATGWEITTTLQTPENTARRDYAINTLAQKTWTAFEFKPEENTISYKNLRHIQGGGPLSGENRVKFERVYIVSNMSASRIFSRMFDNLFETPILPKNYLEHRQPYTGKYPCSLLNAVDAKREEIKARCTDLEAQRNAAGIAEARSNLMTALNSGPTFPTKDMKQDILNIEIATAGEKIIDSEIFFSNIRHGHFDATTNTFILHNKSPEIAALKRLQIAIDEQKADIRNTLREINNRGTPGPTWIASDIIINETNIDAQLTQLKAKKIQLNAEMSELDETAQPAKLEEINALEAFLNKLEAVKQKKTDLTRHITDYSEERERLIKAAQKQIDSIHEVTSSIQVIKNLAPEDPQPWLEKVQREMNYDIMEKRAQKYKDALESIQEVSLDDNISISPRP